jgi:hypothetical protein
MSKRHTIYVLVDENGRYVEAFLSYSEAVREQQAGQRIVTVHGREDY